MTACTCTDYPLIGVGCICRADADAVACLRSARRAWRNPTAAALWLTRHCNRLGGVPTDLILAGRGGEVVAEARRAAAGTVT